MQELQELPVLPLRDVVVYPGNVVSLFVGRERSVAATNFALESKEKLIFLVAQREAKNNSPRFGDIYDVGTIAKVLQCIPLNNGNLKLLLEGLERAEIIQYTDDAENSFEQAQVKVLASEEQENSEINNLSNVIWTQFLDFAKTQERFTSEIIDAIKKINPLSQQLDTIASHLPINVIKKQELLEIPDLIKRATKIIEFLELEIDQQQIAHKIREQVRQQMDKNNRDYYLNEQLKAIHKELHNDALSELDKLKERIKNANLPASVLEKANEEVVKLKMMPHHSSDASVIRNYLDYLLNVPWQASAPLKTDLNQAQKVLDNDHYGLEEIKERIIEFLAVQKRTKSNKSPILCLVGPPGVGKTSLAQSIAHATGRKYVRMALGGVRDEAEIRGHRRTYIGAMPGRIMQKMISAKENNPLFLLDEIDKMGQDMRGDPASALLEVLDPEQNNAFNDHYLEVDYDLSQVMFLCTANSMDIPRPLLDRMEVIRLSGYTEDEKLNIAQKYLVPKQITANGLKKTEIIFESDALLSIIRHYTSEAGVRNLERQIAKVCRKVVKKVVASNKVRVPKTKITAANLTDFLGVIKFTYGKTLHQNRIGYVNGLAWTQVGGELLSIEVAVNSGQGVLIKTGSLGDVISESMTAALTVVRSRAQTLGLIDDFYANTDIHIHMPEGATPKDGPSAGIGLCTALVSALTKIPVRSDVAMTGEVTLRGQVLAIGGLKEKLLAAQRGGIKTVLIPQENLRDLAEIPSNIKDSLNIIGVNWIDEVLEHALQNMPYGFNHRDLIGLSSITEKMPISSH